MPHKERSDLGKWVNISGQLFTQTTKCFVYLVEFRELDKKYIGYKAVMSRKNQKPLNWLNYKTSSKLVRGLLSDGHKAEWYIIKIFDDFDDGYAYERSELIDKDVLGINKDVYLNQCIGHDRMARLPESYTEEAINAAREGLIRYMQTDDYKHPMLGKVHPNKGKRLPQTAPHKHVSVDNIQITDGFVNKWHPKDEEIPDGFRRGMVADYKQCPEQVKKNVEVMREVNQLQYQARIDEYNNNPNFCIICGSSLEYAMKNRKTCSDECNSENRSRISKRLKPTKKSIESGARKRRNDLALSKGFESYDAMVHNVIELCKDKSIVDTAKEVGLSVTGVQSCLRYAGFCLRDYRKLQKRNFNQ